MTTEEFSNGMDTLLNSYADTPLFGEEAGRTSITLNEYEKSFYLTKGQEETVLSLYTGRTPEGDSFEKTEELRRFLSELICEEEITPEDKSMWKGISKNSSFFQLPEDLWFITYESVSVDGHNCGDGTILEVIPVRQDEYHRIKKNPFRGANGRRALRLDMSDHIVEIVSDYTVSSYYVRYLKKLTPIILIDLPDGLEIDHRSEKTPCMLDKNLHQKILERAVFLALRDRGSAPPRRVKNTNTVI